MSVNNNQQTPSGGRIASFPTTHWSAVLSAKTPASAEARGSLESLCRTYWYPLYVYVRRRGHSPHDAQDLTQEFFARLLERNYLEGVDAQKGKFRSFLLVAMSHFLSNQRDRNRAAKRGGGMNLVSLDDSAEDRYALEPATTRTPQYLFERRWALTLLEAALAHVRAEFADAGKEGLFEHLKSFLAEGAESGDYNSAGALLGMSANAVAVTVHRLRQTYREAVRAEIANTVANPEDIDGEMRHLLGVLAS